MVSTSSRPRPGSSRSRQRQHNPYPVHPLFQGPGWPSPPPERFWITGTEVWIRWNPQTCGRRSRAARPGGGGRGTRRCLAITKSRQASRHNTKTAIFADVRRAAIDHRSLTPGEGTGRASPGRRTPDNLERRSRTTQRRHRQNPRRGRIPAEDLRGTEIVPKPGPQPGTPTISSTRIRAATPGRARPPPSPGIEVLIVLSHQYY